MPESMHFHDAEQPGAESASNCYLTGLHRGFAVIGSAGGLRAKTERGARTSESARDAQGRPGSADAGRNSGDGRRAKRP